MPEPSVKGHEAGSKRAVGLCASAVWSPGRMPPSTGVTRSAATHVTRNVLSRITFTVSVFSVPGNGLQKQHSNGCEVVALQSRALYHPACPNVMGQGSRCPGKCVPVPGRFERTCCPHRRSCQTPSWVHPFCILIHRAPIVGLGNVVAGRHSNASYSIQRRLLTNRIEQPAIS